VTVKGVHMRLYFSFLLTLAIAIYLNSAAFHFKLLRILYEWRFIHDVVCRFVN
jgi:hypothetical protein